VKTPGQASLRSPSIFFLSAVLALSGCKHAPLNQPLAKYDNLGGFRYTPKNPEATSADLAVILFFSGGGKRASALSYGVLKELAATTAPIEGHTTRLLDKVEIISSVSGGSFTAAYYALHHDRIFEDYESRFLKKNIDLSLISRLFAPWNWPALASPYYGRSDMAADFYDRHLFDHATFEDLIKTGGRPFLLINSTDMANGEQFSFSQNRFDLLSSDLSKVPLARAVAASSAVPLLLTPVTFKNYAGVIGEVRSDFLPTEPPNPRLRSRLQEVRALMRSYTDAEQRPFIHLMDGGLSDNLGLRSIMDASLLQGGLRGLMARIRMAPPKKLAVVIVNAATRRGGEWTKQEAVPGVFKAVEQLADNIGERVNARSLDLFQQMLEDWRFEETDARRAAALAAGNDPENIAPADYYMITVDFEKVIDPDLRYFFKNLATNFQLPTDTVDQLTQAGATLLRQSPEYQRLLSDLSKEYVHYPIKH
jgi:NTE family protein